MHSSLLLIYSHLTAAEALVTQLPTKSWMLILVLEKPGSCIQLLQLSAQTDAAAAAPAGNAHEIR